MNSIITPLVCPSCQTDNPPANRTCLKCGAVLTVARANMLLDQAQAEIRAGNYERARASLAQADTEMFRLTAEERRSNMLTARAFFLQGASYYNRGQMDEARVESALALQHLEQVADSDHLRTRVLNQLGNIALYFEEYEAAVSYYKEAGETAQRANILIGAAVAKSNLALTYSNWGRADEAFIAFAEAIRLAELSGEPFRIADTYRSAALFYAQCGPFSKAIEYADKALALRDQVVNTDGVCRIISDAAEVYFMYGDTDKAALLLHEAEELAHHIDYKLLYIPLAASMSAIKLQQGKAEEALAYAASAYNQIIITPAERILAAMPFILYYVKSGDPRTAQKYVQRLGDIAPDNPSYSERFRVVRAKALVAAALEKWDEAEPLYQTALALATQSHNLYDHANIQEEYGTIMQQHLLTGQYPEVQQRAHAILAESAATFRQMEMPIRAARIETLLKV